MYCVFRMKRKKDMEEDGTDRNKEGRKGKIAALMKTVLPDQEAAPSTKLFFFLGEISLPTPELSFCISKYRPMIVPEVYFSILFSFPRFQVQNCLPLLLDQDSVVCSALPSQSQTNNSSSWRRLRSSKVTEKAGGCWHHHYVILPGLFRSSSHI